VPGLTPHALPQAAAGLAVSAGANVKAVQRMLGHAAAMSLDVYADLFDDDDEVVARGLADSLRTAPVLAINANHSPGRWPEGGEPPRGIEPRTYALRVEADASDADSRLANFRCHI